MLKDWPKVYERISKVRGLRGMSTGELIVMAQCLAASYDQRLAMNEARLKVMGISKMTTEEKLRIKDTFTGIL